MTSMNQGIIVSTGTETLQVFSRMFVTTKNLELFAPTLNGITLVLDVSSMPVILNA